MNVKQELEEIEQLAAGMPDGQTAVLAFVEAEKERLNLEGQLKLARQKCDDLQRPILEWFSQRGIKNMRIGDRLVHIVRRFKVVPKMGYSKDDVCDALKNTGHADLVTTSYHWTRMASLAKQAEEEGVDLPSELASIIDVNEEYRVQTRK